MSAQCIDKLIFQPHSTLVLYFFFLLEPAVSVCNATSPRASLCLQRDNNWKQIPGPVWRFHTDRTQSPCLSESAEERGLSKHHIPGVATRYVGGLDGLPCRENWPRKQTAVLSGPFLEPPDTAPLDRLTKRKERMKEKKKERKKERMNVYPSEVPHLNVLMRWSVRPSRRVSIFIFTVFHCILTFFYKATFYFLLLKLFLSSGQ